MTTIDLNCDLGEGCGSDAELMRYISSANIACGFHAGDGDTMRRTVELALEQGVAIGAHPGYADPENFGRTQMKLAPAEVRQLIFDQLDALKRVCDPLGAKIGHIKPHGALYNQAAKDRELASAVVEAVTEWDRDLIFYGLSGSEMIAEAQKVGLRTASEVFADRTYQSDGSLTPRTESNALITETETSATQVLDMIRYGRVRSTDAIMVAIKCETICLHGDGDHAVEFASLIRERLEADGVNIENPECLSTQRR
ncbi:MAG TPA: 5-oxoprolinase subunit PxpA [Pyrinomonadaceae bacterium]|nr:5-oxoprolinase subunit PxpA [Pyrinomonadaceae bacterium]